MRLFKSEVVLEWYCFRMGLFQNEVVFNFFDVAVVMFFYEVNI